MFNKDDFYIIVFEFFVIFLKFVIVYFFIVFNDGLFLDFIVG